MTSDLRLMDEKFARATRFWLHGSNTLQIARFCHIPEHLIYNSLDRLKAVAATTPRSPRQGNRLEVAAVAPHDNILLLPVATTLRQEPGNCPSTRETENFREGSA